MKNRIYIGQLADAVVEILDDYKGLAKEQVKETTKEVGKIAVKELQKTSPYRTGKYSKGWKSSVDSETSTNIQMTIHNPTDYQLTHLLENGHAKRGGGRVEAIPHIAPVQEMADQLIVEKLEEKLKG